MLDADALSWPALPTETEIYILPDGRVVIADLPAELALLLAELGAVEPCALLADEDSSARATSLDEEMTTPSHGNQ